MFQTTNQMSISLLCLILWFTMFYTDRTIDLDWIILNHIESVYIISSNFEQQQWACQKKKGMCAQCIATLNFNADKEFWAKTCCFLRSYSNRPKWGVWSTEIVEHSPPAYGRCRNLGDLVRNQGRLQPIQISLCPSQLSHHGPRFCIWLWCICRTSMELWNDSKTRGVSCVTCICLI